MLQVSFSRLSQHSTSSKGQMLSFWERSRRLGHGTLVSLWREVAEGPLITFAVVAQRDTKALAEQRPSIGLR